MRSIDAGILAQFEAKELRPFMLLDMDIDSVHYRRTDCDVPIVFNGNRCEPLGFRISPIRYSATNIVDQVQIDVDNLDQVMTAAFVGGTPQGEDVILEIVVLDSDYNLIPDASTSVTVFEGEIDSWSLDEEKLSVIVTGELAKWAQRTLAIHSASCRWKVFKGTECGYGGAETWCDRTYARCTVLGNTDNFGGFRWLPSIIDKEVWWGRLRGEDET